MVRNPVIDLCRSAVLLVIEETFLGQDKSGFLLLYKLPKIVFSYGSLKNCLRAADVSIRQTGKGPGPRSGTLSTCLIGKEPQKDTTKAPGSLHNFTNSLFPLATKMGLVLSPDRVALSSKSRKLNDKMLSL